VSNNDVKILWVHKVTKENMDDNNEHMIEMKHKRRHKLNKWTDEKNSEWKRRWIKEYNMIEKRWSVPKISRASCSWVSVEVWTPTFWSDVVNFNLFNICKNPLTETNRDSSSLFTFKFVRFVSHEMKHRKTLFEEFYSCCWCCCLLLVLLLLM
jgi:hypothetical protein